MEQARRVDAVRFCRSLLPDSGKNLAIDRSERKDSRTVELTPEMDAGLRCIGPLREAGEQGTDGVDTPADEQTSRKAAADYAAEGYGR